MKTSELSGPALDWAVAKCERTAPGVCPEAFVLWNLRDGQFAYSTDWSQGGPIIEREEIYVRPTGDASKWECYVWGDEDGIGQFIHQQYGPTPLIAAMRCFAASKLGDEIDVPEELK